MIPIPDEEHSLYSSDHIYDQISMYICIFLLLLDIFYYIYAILFVRIWYEQQPSIIQIIKTICIHYILYWLIVLDIYVYSRTIHYTNDTNKNIHNIHNNTIITNIIMICIMVLFISVMIFMTYNKLLYTRQMIIVGGEPIPIHTLQQNMIMNTSMSQQINDITTTTTTKDNTNEINNDPMIIVITGANTGIGKETVRLLHTILTPTIAINSNEQTQAQQAQTQHRKRPLAIILLLCRSVEKGQEAIDDILSNSNNNNNNDNSSIIQEQCQLMVIPCDLCSFQSIRNAVNDIFIVMNGKSKSCIDLQQQPLPSKKIHTLINNAGVMLSQLSYTMDHKETCLQANFLGHFLLSCLLLPYISTSIINITSSTYQLNYKPLLIKNNSKYSWNEHDIQCHTSLSKRKFTLFGQYAITKWCNILHTIYLHQYYSHLFYTAAIHPGLVRTDVVRNMPYYLRIPNNIFASILQTVQKTPSEGAYNTIHVIAVASKWYSTTNSSNNNDEDAKAIATGKTESVPTESTSLLRTERRRQKQQQEKPQQQPSGGQYWVNRQPQQIKCNTKYASIEEQAEALWHWTIQQVQLTDIEIQRIVQLKLTNHQQPIQQEEAINNTTTSNTATATEIISNSCKMHPKTD